MWPFCITVFFLGCILAIFFMIVRRRAEQWREILTIDDGDVFFYAVWKLIAPMHSRDTGDPSANMDLREVFAIRRKSWPWEDLGERSSPPEIDKEVCYKRLHYYYIPGVEKRFKRSPAALTTVIPLACLWLYIRMVGYNSVLSYLIPVFIAMGAIAGYFAFRLNKRELDYVKEIDKKAVLNLKEA